MEMMAAAGNGAPLNGASAFYPGNFFPTVPALGPEVNLPIPYFGRAAPQPDYYPAPYQGSTSPFTQALMSAGAAPPPPPLPLVFMNPASETASVSGQSQLERDAVQSLKPPSPARTSSASSQSPSKKPAQSITGQDVEYDLNRKDFCSKVSLDSPVSTYFSH